VNQYIQDRISQYVVEKLQIAYVCVDDAMVVSDVSSNLRDYGYGDVVTGANVEDHLDFMVGLDSETALELPVVASPSGMPLSVSLLPEDKRLMVLISDASQYYEQRQQLQQKANENELLLNQQEKLMANLELASKELARNNRQLEEASRLQTSFLSGVSHEFRTPLTSIIGYTDLICQKLEKNYPNSHQLTGEEIDNGEEHLRAVQRSSKHLLSLVENLLDHGKLDSNEMLIRPQTVVLSEVFNDVNILLSPLASAKHISLYMQLDFSDELRVVIDDSRLRQCLVNLVGNAIKFTDEGMVKVHAQMFDDQLSVLVEDTGIGISEDDLQSILLPFWQAANTGKVGTGLGLTITEKIINLMGGELKISSALGEGSKVSFDFSAPEAQFDTAAESSSRELFDQQKPVGQKLANKKMKVLLAEDDYDIALIVEIMLQENNVDILHVENGDLAIKALQKQSFDLVLMDINMPVVDGYEAISTLRKKGDKTPIVVMSASALDADRSRAKEVGSDGYLLKPITQEELSLIIEQFC